MLQVLYCNLILFLSRSPVSGGLSSIYFITYLLIYLFIIGASRGAGVQACDCKRDRLWVQFPLKEMKYLIFSLWCRGKLGSALRYSTCNASRIRRKIIKCLNGNGVLILCSQVPFVFVLCAGCLKKTKKKYFQVVDPQHHHHTFLN